MCVESDWRVRVRLGVEAVVRAVMRLAALVSDIGDLIGELDINPPIALPDGAVDALAIPTSPEIDGERHKKLEQTHG